MRFKNICFLHYYVILLMPVIGMTGRYISILLWLLCLLFMLLQFNGRYRYLCKKLYVFTVFLCSLSLVSPFDIVLAPSGKNYDRAVAVLPMTVAVFGQWQPIREMQKDNKVAYKDYVPHIVNNTVFVFPKYALVVYYPSNREPTDPIKLVVPKNE